MNIPVILNDGKDVVVTRSFPSFRMTSHFVGCGARGMAVCRIEFDVDPNCTYLTVLDVQRREFVCERVPIDCVSPAKAGAQFEFRDVTQ